MQQLHINNWRTLCQVLILEYKTQTMLEELLRRLFSTNYQGNLRKFCTDVEEKMTIIKNKLELEGNLENFILYTNARNNTVKT